MSKDPNHFRHIFWFIVGLCSFGAGLTIFLILYLPAEPAERIADTALIFWLSTAVAGGIGYLIGNSAKSSQKAVDHGSITVPEQELEVEPKDPE